jgi:phage terminase large subunit-like protein
MLSNLPAIRLSQYAVGQTATHAAQINALVRMRSPAMTLACRQAGLPLELAEMCGGLLASVVDDLVTVSKLPKTDFERAKRLERVLAAVDEPAVFALKIAMAASPTNGRACARHWDAICDKGERGMLAWRLGLDTDNAHRYGKKIEKLRN